MEIEIFLVEVNRGEDFYNWSSFRAEERKEKKKEEFYFSFYNKYNRTSKNFKSMDLLISFGVP